MLRAYKYRIFIGMLCTDGDAKFIYTNGVIEWLKKEV